MTSHLHPKEMLMLVFSLRRLRGYGALAAFALAAGCSDTESPPTDEFDATELLADVPSQVIFPTYVDLEPTRRRSTPPSWRLERTSPR